MTNKKIHNKPKAQRNAEAPSAQSGFQTRKYERESTNSIPDTEGDRSEVLSKFGNQSWPKAEMKITGINACLMTYEKRPTDIIRAYVAEDNLKHFSKLLKYCAQNKRAYRIVPHEELNKITESTHHEGICLLVKKIPLLKDTDFLANSKNDKRVSCIVALENVENPHNIGAILRVCANFGAQALLLENAKQAQSTAAYRTAEGGAEWVPILETQNLVNALSHFKKHGWRIVATSSHVKHSLYEEKFSHKTLILLGSETQGLSREALLASESQVYIPSTGHVESLNVACATSVILNEFCRKMNRN